MKNNFIELTDQDGTKFTLNILHIVIIEPNKSGTTLQANRGDSFIQKKVKESYSEVKSIIASIP